jgi:hypothetical protein
MRLRGVDKAALKIEANRRILGFAARIYSHPNSAGKEAAVEHDLDVRAVHVLTEA